MPEAQAPSFVAGGAGSFSFLTRRSGFEETSKPAVGSKAPKLNTGVIHMTKCVICEHRPAVKNGRCGNCQAKINAEERCKKPRQPFKFVTYREYVVAFFRNGDGSLNANLVNRNPEKLPKGITINLNRYQDGFTRQQVKKLKQCVLSLAHN